MPRPVPLPSRLVGQAFTPSDQRAAGLTYARLHGSDVQRLFYGVRSVALDTSTTLGRCQALSPRLRAGDFFSHSTAAALHGIPLPLVLQRAPGLHVSTRAPGNRIRTTGVVGHRPKRSITISRPGGVPASDPVSTWLDLATELTIDELIAASDFLVSGRVIKVPGRRNEWMRNPPLATIEQLRAAFDHNPGIRGSRLLREALCNTRVGVDSPRETKLRMLLVRSGLPEPVINGVVRDATGRKVGTPDLKYDQARTVLEYEGDDHRTDKLRFRSDIARRERFEDAGWRVKRVTAEDLDERPFEFVVGVHRLLRARGMQLPPLGPEARAAAFACRNARP
ncbi:hypothetical protein FVA74_01935 [Salinibacterium sp. dk2585]|uniref:hypothetical protein n=1 Tax=unclassified Salinibacterium TaxID=2632331 RepID=UPI0011C24540|nr:MULTISPECIES: hypothetical protein [unclassified Salinibacterium]QEE60467.1 hypothetical protein FVA74_01935 [Salinibacterium sp. dk2585]TXK55540.1 hypothetical protein FVP63_02080 [Salinibacterium sp. dk5596]